MTGAAALSSKNQEGGFELGNLRYGFAFFSQPQSLPNVVSEKASFQRLQSLDVELQRLHRLEEQSCLEAQVLLSQAKLSSHSERRHALDQVTQHPHEQDQVLLQLRLQEELELCTIRSYERCARRFQRVENGQFEK